MKKILFTAALAFAVLFSTQAQERNQRMRGHQNYSVEEIAKMRVDRLDKAVELSDAQKEKVYALELEKAERMKKNRAENKSAQQQNREQWQKQAEKDRQALGEILNDEQKEKLKNTRMSERRERGNRDGKNRQRRNMQQRN